MFTAPCGDAELTTPYCLPEGYYDLQLTADVDVYDPARGQFVCGSRRAITPPAVRRRVTAGQAVNLDAIVLGVNPPQTDPQLDGGAGGSCSSPPDGGV